MAQATVHKLLYMWMQVFTSSSRSLLRKFLSSQWYSYISGGPTDFSVASSNSILDILANSPTFSYRYKPATSKRKQKSVRQVPPDVTFKTQAACVQWDKHTWGRNWQRLLTWMRKAFTSSSTVFWLQCLPFSIHRDWLFSTWISLLITTLPPLLYLEWRYPEMGKMDNVIIMANVECTAKQ